MHMRVQYGIKIFISRNFETLFNLPVYIEIQRNFECDIFKYDKQINKSNRIEKESEWVTTSTSSMTKQNKRTFILKADSHKVINEELKNTILYRQRANKDPQKWNSSVMNIHLEKQFTEMDRASRTMYAGSPN